MKETQSTFKAFLSTGCLVLTLCMLTINFQNCSDLSSADYGSDGDAISQGEDGLIAIGGDGRPVTPVTPTVEAAGLTAVFAAGDTFTGQSLVSAGSFLDSLIITIGYPAFSTGKAIAIANNGMGYAALTGSTDAEAERMAMESCNFLSGRSCALIVSGNTFVAASDQVFAGEDYILQDLTGEGFDRDQIPMARNLVRQSTVVSNFINAPGNRALAISPTGGLYAVYTINTTLTLEEVRRMAVQRCELESAITPCALYAENTEVVFNPEAFMKRSSINFANNNVVALPPPASREGALTAIQILLNDIDREKYAMYITPNGYGYFGTHATDVEQARAEALSRCESGIHGKRCIPYSSSTGVNFSVNDLIAKQNYAGLFCKTVRYSCSEHIAMGCSLGSQYWVQNPSTLQAELTACGN